MKDPGIEPGRTQGLLRLPIHRLDGPCAGYERQLELRRDPGARCYGVKSVAHSVVTWRVIVARLQQRAAGFPVDAENSKGAIDLRKLSGATASEIHAHVARTFGDVAMAVGHARLAISQCGCG